MPPVAGGRRMESATIFKPFSTMKPSNWRRQWWVTAICMTTFATRALATLYPLTFHGPQLTIGLKF